MGRSNPLLRASSLPNGERPPHQLRNLPNPKGLRRRFRRIYRSGVEISKINKIMNWLELFKDLGFVGIIAGTSVWLIRKVAEQLLTRDLVKFKADLEKQAVEFKIRYERIQGERVEVIKEVYKKIVRTYKSLNSLILEGPQAEKEGEIIETAKRAIDLIDYYEENRIFFEEKLAKDIDFLLSSFSSVLGKCGASRISRKIKDYKVAVEQWKSAFDQIQKEIPNIKKQLENEFRKIIGIE